jgi:hypothetical protein
MYAFVLNKVVRDSFLFFSSWDSRPYTHFFEALTSIAGNDFGSKMLGDAHT